MRQAFERVELDPESLKVIQEHPSAIYRDGWMEVQDLRRDAFNVAFPDRSDSERAFLAPCTEDAALQLGIDMRFPERVYPGNSYLGPTVARAYDGDQLIGFAAMAHNTSGFVEALRQVKMHSVGSRYAWVREVVVDPRYQRQGVSDVMVHTLLRNFDQKQPVSAYTWEENKLGSGFVKGLGLLERCDKDTKEVLKSEPFYPFGPDTKPVRQIAWSNRTVGKVRAAIRTRHSDLISAMTVQPQF